jgi:hypothetical protein
MADLPTGTVTFLFTDLEGSTRLLQAHPHAYREAVRRHHALLRPWPRRSGTITRCRSANRATTGSNMSPVTINPCTSRRGGPDPRSAKESGSEGATAGLNAGAPSCAYRLCASALIATHRHAGALIAADG